jgi:hypothetical protein
MLQCTPTKHNNNFKKQKAYLYNVIYYFDFSSVRLILDF